MLLLGENFFFKLGKVSLEILHETTVGKIGVAWVRALNLDLPRGFLFHWPMSLVSFV